MVKTHHGSTGEVMRCEGRGRGGVECIYIVRESVIMSKLQSENEITSFTYSPNDLK